MAEREYSSVAAAAELSGAVSGSATVLALSTVAGLPSVPFTLIVDAGVPGVEEIVTVTSLAGLNATVVRGEDGTAAVPHQVGALVRHGVTARDLRAGAQHRAATQGVHGVGVSASVVGTTTSQTLTNKTVSDSVVDGSNAIDGGALNALSVDNAAIKTGVSGSKISAGISASNVTAGTLPIARIADGSVTRAKADSDMLPRSGYWSENTPEFTGSASGTHRLNGINIPPKSYRRKVWIQSFCTASVDASTAFTHKIMVANAGDTNDSETGNTLATGSLYNSQGTANRYVSSITACMDVAGGDSPTVRSWLEKVSGAAQTFLDTGGYSMRIDWVEIPSGNDW